MKDWLQVIGVLGRLVSMPTRVAFLEGPLLVGGAGLSLKEEASHSLHQGQCGGFLDFPRPF